ncbi:hypothetical protein BMG46_21750 [Salmonella enterica]|nr:hypothetical protein [Salmonella enterica]
MKSNSNDKIESTEEWNAVTNKIQFIYHSLGKRYFEKHIDIYRIVLGKVGLKASLAVLMAKHKAGLRFWRFWFLGFIPWERKTVTPASIWQHPALERIYDSPETVRK